MAARKKTVSSKYRFVKRLFRQTTVSSKHRFVKKPIRRNTGSSKNRFVKMLVRQNASPEFVKRPVRQKNGSSKKRFVKKTIRQKTVSSKNRFVKKPFRQKLVRQKINVRQKRCCFVKKTSSSKNVAVSPMVRPKRGRALITLIKGCESYRTGRMQHGKRFGLCSTSRF